MAMYQEEKKVIKRSKFGEGRDKEGKRKTLNFVSFHYIYQILLIL